MHDKIHRKASNYTINFKDCIKNNKWLTICGSMYFSYIENKDFRLYVDDHIHINKLKLHLISNFHVINICQPICDIMNNVSSLCICEYIENIEICNLKLLESLYLLKCNVITNVQKLPLLNAFIIDNCNNAKNIIDDLTSITILGLFRNCNIINIGYLVNLKTLCICKKNKHIYGIHLLKKLDTVYNFYDVSNKLLTTNLKKVNKYMKKTNNKIEYLWFYSYHYNIIYNFLLRIK